MSSRGWRNHHFLCLLRWCRLPPPLHCLEFFACWICTHEWLDGFASGHVTGWLWWWIFHSGRFFNWHCDTQLCHNCWWPSCSEFNPDGLWTWQWRLLCWSCRAFGPRQRSSIFSQPSGCCNRGQIFLLPYRPWNRHHRQITSHLWKCCSSSRCDIYSAGEECKDLHILLPANDRH